MSVVTNNASPKHPCLDHCPENKKPMLGAGTALAVTATATTLGITAYGMSQLGILSSTAIAAGAAGTAFGLAFATMGVGVAAIALLVVIYALWEESNHTVRTYENLTKENVQLNNLVTQFTQQQLAQTKKHKVPTSNVVQQVEPENRWFASFREPVKKPVQSGIDWNA